jgi:hypothetical protein
VACWTSCVVLYLLECTPAAAGAELRRVAIPSRFTHDVVRVDDSVFVCDTGNGRLLQLSFPDMTPVSCYLLSAQMSVQLSLEQQIRCRRVLQLLSNKQPAF